MAIEYASSPVEQPGTHARTEAPADLPSKSSGTTVSSSVWNASGSRKKQVTPISRSRNSESTSSGVRCRYWTYSSIVPIWWAASLRSMRRWRVPVLYWEKSWPVWARSRRMILFKALPDFSGNGFSSLAGLSVAWSQWPISIPAISAGGNS
jgi:hypothetical protein